MENTELINQIIEILHHVSSIMMKRDFEIKEKGDVSNLVTSSDIAVQRELKERLTRLIPGSLFIGEEGDIPEFEAEYVWVVDPIDGTANYARNLGLSVISVALIYRKNQHIGVVFFPYREETFYAIAGEGAFLNGERIHVSDRPFRASLFCTATCLYDKSLAGPCFKIMERVYSESDDFRRLGAAALELCEVAAGRADLYFEIRLSCWDYAAATLIIKEAGGFVDVMFEDDIPLNKPAGVIAANTAENFEHLKEIVYDVVPKALY